jgi:predicted dehydrogenase
VARVPERGDNAIPIRQSWPAPSRPRPIVLIGAGGIVNDAHLPAYRNGGYAVAGIYDVDPDRARATADKWDTRALASMGEVVAHRDVVFDIAVPPEHEFDVLAQLPPRSVVLLQKPMGVHLADARRIRDLCRERGHTACVNFQMRFAPMMLAAKSILDAGAIGDVVDLSFHFNLRTPWELFPFLVKLRRVEIMVHTIHHLDFCRHVLGEPAGVYARTVQHPAHLNLASTRTSAILDYGQQTRCCLSINHEYAFIQGTRGAIRVSLGLLLNYPTGRDETVEYCTADQPWTSVPIAGRWFPNGFTNLMNNLQRYASGEDDRLITHVDDAYRTMALCEACYASDSRGATPIPD